VLEPQYDQRPVTKRSAAEPPPRLLTLPEACEILSCSIKTLRRRIAAGEVPVIRDGRLIRIHPDDLQRYIRQRRSL
jgi:excisionase family DNA binding protein